MSSILERLMNYMDLHIALNDDDQTRLEGRIGEIVKGQIDLAMKELVEKQLDSKIDAKVKEIKKAIDNQTKDIKGHVQFYGDKGPNFDPPDMDADAVPKTFIHHYKQQLSDIAADIAVINGHASKFLELNERLLAEKEKAVLARQEAENNLTTARTQQTEETKRLKGEIARLEDERDTTNKDLAEARGKFKKLSGDFNDNVAKLKVAKESLGQKDAELSAVREELDVWQKSAVPYAPVHERLIACEFFAPFCKRYGITKEVGGLFSLIQRIGSSADFLEELFSFAQKEKNENQEKVSEGEAMVYAAINECCRKVWSVDFDVLFLPGGQSLVEPFKKCAFDKAEVEHLVDSRKVYKNVETVFVPAVRNKTGGLLRRALVKGTNL